MLNFQHNISTCSSTLSKTVDGMWFYLSHCEIFQNYEKMLFYLVNEEYLGQEVLSFQVVALFVIQNKTLVLAEWIKTENAKMSVIPKKLR